jgi:hypothetical protein
LLSPRQRRACAARGERGQSWCSFLRGAAIAVASATASAARQQQELRRDDRVKQCFASSVKRSRQGFRSLTGEEGVSGRATDRRRDGAWFCQENGWKSALCVHGRKRVVPAREEYLHARLVACRGLSLRAAGLAIKR